MNTLAFQKAKQNRQILFLLIKKSLIIHLKLQRSLAVTFVILAKIICFH